MNWPVVGWPTQSEFNPEYWPNRMQRTELFTQAAWGFAGEPQIHLGYKWTVRKTSGLDNNWTCISWSPELRLFCALASSGTGNRVMTSPTGETWTASQASSDSPWNSICWSKRLGVYCGVAGDGKIMTSSNGKQWSEVASISADFRSVCEADSLGLLCVVGRNSSTGRSLIYTSSDSLTWTQQTHPWTNNAGDSGARSVCWSKSLGLLVAVSANTTNSNVVAVSSDGASWTGVTLSHTINTPKIAWFDELGYFVIYDAGGVGYDLSKNGTSWNAFGVGDTAYLGQALSNDAVYCPNIGRIVFARGFSTNRFPVCRDLYQGSTGISQNSYAAARGTQLNYNGITYSRELNRLVAVASTGTGNRVATSP